MMMMVSSEQKLKAKSERAADYMLAKLTESIELYRVKNVAYGDSFGESVEEFGPIAAIVRMGDKFNRIKSLLLKHNPNDVKDETVEDTLIDLACYSMMLAYELKAKKEEETWKGGYEENV